MLSTFGIYGTGLPDFHKQIFTVLKMFYVKQKPRIIKYRDYKHFNKITSKIDLVKQLPLSDFDKFKFVVNDVLESNAPMNEKFISVFIMLSLN